jgi:hypothetical protein
VFDFIISYDESFVVLKHDITTSVSDTTNRDEVDMKVRNEEYISERHGLMIIDVYGDLADNSACRSAVWSDDVARCSELFGIVQHR